MSNIFQRIGKAEQNLAGTVSNDVTTATNFIQDVIKVWKGESTTSGSNSSGGKRASGESASRHNAETDGAWRKDVHGNTYLEIPSIKS
jgi:hypothetical protein